MQILETEYQDIYKNQWLSQTKMFLNGTPSNYIIFKVLPGLGATHGEILLYLWRNSIIAEPNVPVIVGKETELDDQGMLVYPNMLGVYGNVSKAAVMRYLKSDITPKKIVCTPEAFESKVKPAINECDGFDLYKDFFMLLDECDKLTTENDYRDKIIAPMDDFFLFDNKAMVSATALTPSDPRFAANGFKILEIRPQYEYKRKVNLLSTNNVIGTLSKVVQQYNNEQYFIFINSTDLIYAVMKSLGIMEQSRVFCASKSVRKLIKMGFTNTSDTLGEFATYNFLTSRFFSAVDIKLGYKPNVVMLTNVFKAPHSIIDPYTDAVQIIGRFRNGTTRNTQITNFNSTIKYQQPEEAIQYINEGYDEYKRISDRFCQVNTKGGFDTIMQATQRTDIKKFINDKHELMPFMVDNHIHEQKIRSYYRGAIHLEEAYRRVAYFNMKPSTLMFTVSDSQLYDLELNKGKSHLIECVASILKSYESPITQDLLVFSLGETVSEVKNSYPEIVRDYNAIGGYERMQELEFNQARITREVKRLKKKGDLYIKEMVDEIHTWYKPDVDKPSSADIRRRLKATFVKYNIDKAVTATTIKYYYDADLTTDRNGEKVWVIKGFK